MPYRMQVLDWGLIPYKQALNQQENVFYAMVQAREQKLPMPDSQLIFCEHPPVFTLGKHGAVEHLEFSLDQLEKTGVDFYRIKRGGDITFHGPGQLVVYFIWDLETLELGLKNFVKTLEATVIRTLKSYGLSAGTLAGAPGVWIGDSKICALGIQASRMVTMHGLALNVATDLRYFDWIIPCGIPDKGVTSMEAQLGEAIPVKEVKARFLSALLEEMQASLAFDHLPLSLV